MKGGLAMAPDMSGGVTISEGSGGPSECGPRTTAATSATVHARSENLVEVSSLLHKSVQSLLEDAASGSQTVVEAGSRVRKGSSAGQPAIMTLQDISTHKETENHDIPQKELQMVGAPDLSEEEFPSTEEVEHPCPELPKEEMVLLSLEEAEEGIRLVGEPVVWPITSLQNLNTTISLFNPGVLKKESPGAVLDANHNNQDKNKFTEVVQNSQTGMKMRFDEDTDDGCVTESMNGAGLSLEGPSKAWLGCCLCYEVLPSREALHLHIIAAHQQPSSTSQHQISPVLRAEPHKHTEFSSQCLLEPEPEGIDAHGPDVVLEAISKEKRPTFWPLPVSGKFMGINKVLDVLKRTGEVLDFIPPGEKSNVFFVIKKGWQGGKLSCHDDCGDWSSKDTRSVDSYFLLDSDGNIKNVFLKNNLYVTHKRKMKKSVWAPLQPQPPEKSILKVHRFYTTLKANDDYVKRLTCVMSGDVGYSDRMLVEYCGKYIKMQPGDTKKRMRGNNHINAVCESNKSCYVCLDENGSFPEKVTNHKHKQEELRNGGKNMKQKQDEIKVSNLVDYMPERRNILCKNWSDQPVFEAVVNETEHHDEKPKTLRQVIYQKLEESKNSGPGFRYYFMEEIAEVLEMLKNDVDVQEIIDRKNKPPNVIIYSTEQINDMISEVASGSIVGINRTINFRACYITIAVYKSSKVFHKHSEKNPLLLGPIYLHWDGEFGTYFSFFSHLKSVLYQTALNFEIRSDNGHEEMLMKAINRCFPDAECTLCPKHLRDCMRDYLYDVVRCELEDENAIINKIFGHAGVVMSKDLHIFEKRVSSLQTYFEKFPMFKTYFDNLKPVLIQYMWEPNRKGISKNLWASSNREPVNLILKLTTNWRSQRLAALIKKMCSVSKKQLSDMRRSLYDPGNYVLLEKYKGFSVNKDIWHEITPEEQDIIFMKFLKKDMPSVWT